MPRGAQRKSHHSRADRNIFEGFKVKGAPAQVIVNGRVQYAGGKLAVERGAGRFIKRSVTRTANPVPVTAVSKL